MVMQFMELLSWHVLLLRQCRGSAEDCAPRPGHVQMWSNGYCCRQVVILERGTLVGGMSSYQQM